MQLNLPPIEPRLRRTARGIDIFDPLRGRFVALTPEEWVRQHFTACLADRFGYPRGLMANEVAMRLNSTLKRCDTIVYDHARRPLVIVEYKAPDIAITREVFAQILRYYSVLRAPWLMVSNGLVHRCCHIGGPTADDVTFVNEIPRFEDICRQEP